MTLKGKAALVTGAAKRVGRTIALALARRGANVAVHFNSSADEAERTAAEIRALGVEAMTVKAELTREAEIRAMTDAVAARFGRLDVLVNNAAVFFRTPLESVSEADWDRTLGPNLKAPFFCAV
ncbi:MAG: SDR family NAD(P)-dependent oxidoreductase, partial [bacterium]